MDSLPFPLLDPWNRKLSFGHWKNEQAEEALALANAPQPSLLPAPAGENDGAKGDGEMGDGEKGGEKVDGEKGDGGVHASAEVVEESPFHPPTELDPDTLQTRLSGAVPTILGPHLLLLFLL